MRPLEASNADDTLKEGFFFGLFCFSQAGCRCAREKRKEAEWGDRWVVAKTKVWKMAPLHLRGSCTAVAPSSGHWMMKMNGWMKHPNANNCFVEQNLGSFRHFYKKKIYFAHLLADSSPASQNMTRPIRILHRCYKGGGFIRTGHHVLIKATLCHFSTIK